MSAGRVYMVSVEFQYACVAESRGDAERQIDGVLRSEDICDACTAGPVRFVDGAPTLPEGWETDTRVYNADDLTLTQALEKHGNSE